MIILPSIKNPPMGAWRGRWELRAAEADLGWGQLRVLRAQKTGLLGTLGQYTNGGILSIFRGNFWGHILSFWGHIIHFWGVIIKNGGMLQLGEHGFFYIDRLRARFYWGWLSTFGGTIIYNISARGGMVPAWWREAPLIQLVFRILEKMSKNYCLFFFLILLKYLFW